jgi:hypothetical protein
VEVAVELPSAEDTLKVSSYVRKGVSMEINLQNPLDEAVEFEVTMKGSGLFGAPKFRLQVVIQ